MPSFSNETRAKWSLDRVIRHSSQSRLRELLKREIRNMCEELLESSSEEQARWLLGRMTEHEIVQQCANVKGRQWLEEQGGHPR